MTQSSWLEISLTVDGELAESVAEVMARFIPDGVVIESTAVTANLNDSVDHAVGPLRVFGYLPYDSQLEETRRHLEESLWYLGRIRPLPEVKTRLIQQTNWAESWKQHYQPIAVGNKLMIVPTWIEPPSLDRIPVRIDPGMAFGTGTHPSTQMCLEIMESQATKASEAFRDWEVIDLGCGTAILAIAALKLGAKHALGVDIDSEAIRAAQENAKTNGVADRLEVGVGSLAEILAGAFSFQKAHLLLANILTPVLISLLDKGLCDLLTSQGYLVLSGVLLEQAWEIEAAVQRHNLCFIDRRQIGDWVALCYQSGEKPTGTQSRHL